MATFGDLVVRLNLDKRGFDRNIGAARSGLNALKSVALPAAAAIGAVAAAAVGAAVAFKAWLAPSFESLDTLGDLSKRLGVATDALAGIQHAAKLAGIDQDALTIGIQKFLDTLSNANIGTKSAVKAFDALGLKASALRNLSLDQQFVAVANAMQGIQNPADRVRIALDLFGKSGAQMLQLLADGSEDLTAALEEAQRLGIAPKPEEVARIQEANDALDKMSAAWRGIANTVAIDIAPAVETVANAFVSLAPIITGQVATAFDGLMIHLSVLSDGIDALFAGKSFDIKGSYVTAINDLKQSKVQDALGGAKAAAKAAGNAGKLRPIEIASITDSFEKSKSREDKDSGPKSMDRMKGSVRNSVAAGGMKGAQDTLGRILRAGATKDPVVKAVKEETTIIKGMAKDIKKLATGGAMGGGLIVGAAGAGV